MSASRSVCRVDLYVFITLSLIDAVALQDGWVQRFGVLISTRFPLAADVEAEEREALIDMDHPGLLR